MNIKYFIIFVLIKSVRTSRFGMKQNVNVLLSTFLTFIVICNTARAEYSSALVDLEPLLGTQREVVKALEEYLTIEEQRLKKIKNVKEDYDKLHKTAAKDVDIFLSNPINSYLLVKRLSKDWKYILNVIETNSSEAVISNITKKEIFPKKDDLDEAANALIRLQDTYLLNTTKLAKGEVGKRNGTSKFTASDCFQLGVSAFDESYFNHSVLWLQESLNRLDESGVQMVNRSVILDHMAYSAYLLGNVQLALDLTITLISVDPKNPRARNNIRLFKEELREGKDKKETKKKSEKQKKHQQDSERDEETKGTGKSSEYGIDVPLMDEEKYKKLCRGKQLRSPAQESKLSCRYTTSGSKYLLLQPVKEETLNLDPWIVVYHDVIRDRDIELLKEIAGPTLKRATVLNPKTGTLDFAKYRVSKSGWLADKDHPRVAHISLLIEEITGLETDTAEFLQINKYGLGGYYEGHYDFRLPGKLASYPEFGTGNRIATWLFYLSDVDAGGSTVFPNLDVQVNPIKGSAGFWFNLYKNGSGDFRTGHAACPVLSGTKWVANKWLHEKDQEFRRSCSLNPFE